MTAHAYVVGLGSNLGSRAFAIAAAAHLIDARDDTRVIARSRLYASSALTLPGTTAQPDYLNAALAVHSELTPEGMLRALLAIEAALGRVRRERWGARTIDLDLLWGEQAVTRDELVLPHPELHRRSFALAPLLDVAPALGAVLSAELQARYAPALEACGAIPRALESGYERDACSVERREITGALVITLRTEGALEDASAQLLLATGTVLAVELRMPPPCTPLGAHVAVLDDAPDLAPVDRLRALTTELIARVQNGLFVSLAVVSGELASARFIGAPARDRAERHAQVAVEAMALEPRHVAGAGDEVRATVTLLLSKLGDSPRDSLS